MVGACLLKVIRQVSFSYRLKENYILLSTDGPGRNVLKFKPPLCFSLDNAQHVVAKLDDILTGELDRTHLACLRPLGVLFDPQHHKCKTSS